MVRVSRAAAMLLASFAVAVTVSVAAPAGVAASNAKVDCHSEDNERRIQGCSILIETPGLPSDELSLAYAMRALAYSLVGHFDKGLQDYDAALAITPDFPLALNNRAWSYYKLDRAAEGVADVERALKLAPDSPSALDTRAHIRQSLGQSEAAYEDYNLAMRLGGKSMVKMYQCGLKAHGLYFGAVDGERSETLQKALRACSGMRQCDPLPADAECLPEVS
ncbi:tetratricopeptide repeat protein [Hyphomicrobium sp. D-2]|uniref:tetratricopeptide repeat protein n=1 Tax=Hyphomicrobium sp. D-2 TaxID=3041621 RepID=UPI0024548ADF|nr:tetratricopeptide repeat protein [Hyphomicrobium sp. D-2]MDH4983086.1 tetratricopeptide repeat protein [Hyphomicrobium sp. D-2]